MVEEYLKAAGVQTSLDALGFNLAGFGCTTCIGNSGPLDEPIVEAVEGNGLVVAAVLSGNRNFEGRISPQVKANYLASPPLVVAYAIAGTMNLDLATEPLGIGKDGKPVFLKDIWPTNAEIKDGDGKERHPRDVSASVTPTCSGSGAVAARSSSPTGQTYKWDDRSTYVQESALFRRPDQGAAQGFSDIRNARLLALLGDSITTDHISPAGNIKSSSPAGQFLVSHQVRPVDFNSYGARRGNDDVMTRGTFANVRIKNEMVAGVEGGVTRYKGTGDQLSIYDAAVKYKAEGIPLVVIAGKEYGTGSSRDWAAKGTILLGVKAVIAESFERIHRSNLVGMGVLPLQFKRRHRPQNTAARRHRDVRHSRPRRRHQAAPGRDGDRHPQGRRQIGLVALLPDRYARRGGVLPPRRHPEVRAARIGRLIQVPRPRRAVTF